MWLENWFFEWGSTNEIFIPQCCHQTLGQVGIYTPVREGPNTDAGSYREKKGRSL
jgi:hypothetical protein